MIGNIEQVVKLAEEGLGDMIRHAGDGYPVSRTFTDDSGEFGIAIYVVPAELTELINELITAHVGDGPRVKEYHIPPEGGK